MKNIFRKNKEKELVISNQKLGNASDSRIISPNPYALIPNPYSSGFTIVETLVAITILMIAVAGPLTVAEKGLSASIYARDQLMASYLAQDAMESIKNIVDTNEINGAYNHADDTWIEYKGEPGRICTSLRPCEINTITGAMTQCPNSNPTLCPPLYLSSSGYTYGLGQATPFTRYFYLEPFGINGTNCSPYPYTSCNAANVIVNVTWPGQVIGGGGVQLEDTMYDTPLP